MLGRGRLRPRSVAMDVRQYIRPDVTVSAFVHLSLVAVVVIYTEVRPFQRPVEKAIPVDVVIVEEKKPAPVAAPQSSPELTAPEKPALSPATAPAVPQAASPPQPPASRANQWDTQPQPQEQPQVAAQAPSSPPSSARGYTPPEPDLTIKYHVMLGLPEDVPALPSPSVGDKHGEGGNTGPASDKLGSSVVDALRRHLKSCSKLPAALSPSDNVAVKLRVQLTANGRLAAEPALIEGTASMKGVQLMQGAIAALSACQPYAMLPADRFGEWKVLDLSFTPHDFNS
jgi:hypothetical protein